VSEPGLTTLVAGPRGWQRVQRWPGALLLAAGLWSLRYGLEPVALASVAVGFWGTAEFWRGARVTGGVLVARGRVSRRVLSLAEVRQVGHTSAGVPWVRPVHGRTLVLSMAEARLDQPGAGREIAAALREQAEQAGAHLEPAADEEPAEPPRPATPFFGW
jgi:hypothetical protein